jgi:hypothetical protein
MKKIYKTLAVLVLLFPSVTLASWWKPFSWGIFHRENKIIIIENNDKVFDKKSENKISTTTEYFESKIIKSTTTSVVKSKKNINKISDSNISSSSVKKIVKTYSLPNGVIIDEYGNILYKPLSVEVDRNVVVDNTVDLNIKSIHESNKNEVVNTQIVSEKNFIPSPDYDSSINPKIKNFSIYKPSISKVDKLENIAYFDIDTNGGEPVILKKARVQISASVTDLYLCKAAAYSGCLIFNYLNDTSSWSQSEKITSPYQSYILKFNGVNAIPGTYSVTIKYIEVVGVESGKTKYIEGLPLSFNFEIN